MVLSKDFDAFEMVHVRKKRPLSNASDPLTMLAFTSTNTYESVSNKEKLFFVSIGHGGQRALSDRRVRSLVGFYRANFFSLNALYRLLRYSDYLPAHWSLHPEPFDGWCPTSISIENSASIWLSRKWVLLSNTVSERHLSHFFRVLEFFCCIDWRSKEK